MVVGTVKEKSVHGLSQIQDDSDQIWALIDPFVPRIKVSLEPGVINPALADINLVPILISIRDTLQSHLTKPIQVSTRKVKEHKTYLHHSKAMFVSFFLCDIEIDASSFDKIGRTVALYLEVLAQTKNWEAG